MVMKNHEHMVFPGMVYISHPTEYGTLYTKKELTELSAVCRNIKFPLFMDGARLIYGLVSKETDVTLQDIAKLCDVFYIGGTKAGAFMWRSSCVYRRQYAEAFPYKESNSMEPCLQRQTYGGAV